MCVCVCVCVCVSMYVCIPQRSCLHCLFISHLGSRDLLPHCICRVNSCNIRSILLSCMNGAPNENLSLLRPCTTYLNGWYTFQTNQPLLCICWHQIKDMSRSLSTEPQNETDIKIASARIPAVKGGEPYEMRSTLAYTITAQVLHLRRLLYVYFV